MPDPIQSIPCDACNGTGRPPRFVVPAIISLIIFGCAWCVLFLIDLSLRTSGLSEDKLAVLQSLIGLCTGAALGSLSIFLPRRRCRQCNGSGIIKLDPNKPTPFIWPKDRARLQTENCPECGYDLRSTFADRCPECGLDLRPYS